MAANAPLNVWLITAEYPPAHKGGQGVHTRDLAHGLAELGCSVTVLAFTPQDITVSPYGPINVHFISAKSSGLDSEHAGFITAINALNEEFIRYGRELAFRQGEKPDIIHCQDWILFPAGQVLAHTWGVRVVSTVHLLDEPCQRWWGQVPDPENVRQEQRYCREADALIAVSQAMADVINQTHQVPNERLYVVHNGVNTPLFQPNVSPEARSRLRQTVGGDGNKIILFAGRLSPVKGIDAFFAAAVQVVAAFPNVRYLIAGEPASRTSAQSVKALQQQHPELNTHLKILGKIPQKQLALLYQAADLAVVSSLFESFGFAAAEPMAAGVPVVATETGGLPEIITHEKTGLLVPVFVGENGKREVDVTALAGAQCRLLQDEALARQLGKAGQKRIMAHFRQERMVQETLAVYHRVRHQPSMPITTLSQPASPWDDAGWLEAVTLWVKTEMGHNSRFLTGPSETVRRSPDGCILRFPTGKASVYLKAVPSHYAHEPVLTEALARQFSAHITPVLAVEPKQRWLLTEEMSGRPLYETFDLRAWQKTMRILAQMQIHFADKAETLLALGCFDRRLARLGERLRLFQAAASHFNLDSALFVQIAPQVELLCQQVASYQIPATLEHGDFHPNNIFIAGQHPVIFDWADSAVSHPFFSPAALLGYITLTLPDMQEHEASLQAAYLQPWTTYRPMAELVRSFEIIRPLATLHYALNMFECWQSRPQPNPVEPEMMKAVSTCMQLTVNTL
ncbi:MAG: glycosyltransferase [Anaerolineae bacterium]|nr:glycosyltransferase [Anaerolineae bacterium]